MNITIPLDDYVIEMDSDLEESLSTAKTFVALATMMISYAMYRCEFRFISGHPELNTACAVVRGDGNYLYFDRDCWLNKFKNDKQRAFVVYHEVMHIFLEHGMRGSEGSYNHSVWGIATDHCINLAASGSYLDVHGNVSNCARMNKFLEVPDWVYHDTKYTGDSSDDIYEKLLNEIKDELEKAPKSGGSGSGEASSIDSTAEELYGKQFDPIIPTDASDDSIKKQQTKNQQTIVAGATIAEQSKAIGKSEEALKKTIMEMVKPAVQWQDHLLTTTISSIPENSTYNRLSRRSSGGIVFPTYNGEHLNIMIGVDSSGSMSQDDYVRCYTELVSVLRQIDSWDLWLVTCDTAAHLISHTSSEDVDDPEDIDFTVVGGGGTDMQPLLEYADYLIEEGNELDLCIVMTDGFIPERSVDAMIPVGYTSLFLVTDRGNRDLKLENHEVILTS